MKWSLPVTIAVLAVFTNGDVTAQGNPTPPCRARTLDLRASVQQSGSSCKMLYNEMSDYSPNSAWQMEYDTGMAFVDQCPNDPNSYWGFHYMTEAVSELGNSDALRAKYLAWLKSVLYVNTTNPEYFCWDVEAIAGELPISHDTTPGTVSKMTNNTLSVIAWLMRNTTCDTPALWDQYQVSRRSQRQDWLNDTNAYPLDTTLPSMADLGLDTLLNEHFQYVSGVAPDNFNQIVPTFGVSENPFTKVTGLWFDLSQSTYLGIQVFDLEGRPVIGDGSGIVYSPGAHDIPIDLRDYPAGSYYLRVALGTGEVRTIKLIKD